MSLKRDYSIPATQAKLSSAVDFSGYIYPQFVTTSGFNIVTPETIFPGASNSSFIKKNKQTILSSVLNAQTGNVMAGIRKFSKTFKRDLFKRKQLGNFEYYQSVPGTIGISLGIDKVSFYESNNELDRILDIDYDGSIKQSAPLMLIENIQTPKGDIKTIMYLDCWITSSKIDYQLENNILVVNSLGVEVTKVFVPLDIKENFMETIYNKIGLAESATDFNFNISTIL